MNFNIAGIQKSSLLDYPGKISAIVFTQGCNLNCPYCHNPELLCCKKAAAIRCEEVLNFLKTRVKKLDAVVISGGEPCLQKDLEGFITRVKEMNFLIKLDTNGTHPNVVERLFQKNLLDYIAMDIKGPLEKYPIITKGAFNKADIAKTVSLIKSSGVEYEFRTTVLKPFLTLEDFKHIGEFIKGAKKYYLQKFTSSKTADTSLTNANCYNDEEFEEIAATIKKYVKNTKIR